MFRAQKLVSSFIILQLFSNLYYSEYKSHIRCPKQYLKVNPEIKLDLTRQAVNYLSTRLKFFSNCRA